MIWNSIPLEIRKLTSTSEFRAKMEAHLWDLLLKNEMEREGV